MTTATMTVIMKQILAVIVARIVWLTISNDDRVGIQYPGEMVPPALEWDPWQGRAGEGL